MSAGRLSHGIGLGWMCVVFLFLYLPILSLVVGSFNQATLASLWGGWTWYWYAQLWQDQAILEAFKLSLLIAATSATASVLLGTLAALVLVRLVRFRGRTLFSAMVTAPLVMPDVMVGLSLLLLLVAGQQALGFPSRGMLTIVLGHTLLGMAYATVVIRARLLDMDKSLEEAALDLGARPATVFRRVTLPLMAQSLLAAWLLAFTLSLDDVVLATFLSGPGSNTLPMVIFARAKLGLNPTVNAVAALTVVGVGCVLMMGSLWMARQEKLRSRDRAWAMRQSRSPQTLISKLQTEKRTGS